MKKILWLFGYEGSGVRELISELKNGNNEVMESIGLAGSSIRYAEIQGSSNIGELYEKERKKNSLFTAIHDFIDSDDTVLLIKESFAELYNHNESIIPMISSEFPDLTQELMLLWVSDTTVFYERMKASPIPEKGRFDPVILDQVYTSDINLLSEYADDKVSVSMVDTLNGYDYKKLANDKIMR